MAFDANGIWKPEDDSTSGKLTGLLAQDSPLMEQAATQGAQRAGQRGLANSTMGVQASQSALIAAATPIAAADANAISAKNLAQMGYDSQSKLQAGQIASSEKMQQADIAAQDSRLAQQLGSQSALQAAQNAAEKDRLGMQLTATEQSQLRDLNAAMDRLGVTTNANMTMAQQQIASSEKMNAAGLLSQKDIAAMQIAGQKDANTQSIAAQTDIAKMQVASADRERAATALSSAASSYADMFNAIAANENIPAATRDAYLAHIGRTDDSNKALIEQLYNVDLTWGSAGGTPTQPGGLGPGLAPAPQTAAQQQAAAAAQAQQAQQAQAAAAYAASGYADGAAYGYGGGSYGRQMAL